MSSKRAATFLIGACASLALAATAFAVPRLESRIDVASAFVTQSDDVWVRVVIENKGAESARILRWHLPLAPIGEDLFAVDYDGAAATYLGRHYKRPAPRPEDWVTLAPGKAIEGRVEISALYDLSRGGEYTLAFVLPADAVAGGAGRGAVASNPVSLWMDGDAKRAEVEAPAPTRSLTPVYRNCSNSQQTALATALPNAQTYAQNAHSYLVNYPSGSRASSVRYNTWFGTYSSGNWSTATNHFLNIGNAMATQQFTFDCGCTDNYYAYVYPNQPYIVYLCNVFWNAPATGTDSKAGTLVHETSHFTVVAGTNDNAYGQTACKSLAQRSPKKALDNADSHEYFAENSPSLP